MTIPFQVTRQQPTNSIHVLHQRASTRLDLLDNDSSSNHHWHHHHRLNNNGSNNGFETRQTRLKPQIFANNNLQTDYAYRTTADTMIATVTPPHNNRGSEMRQMRLEPQVLFLFSYSMLTNIYNRLRVQNGNGKPRQHIHHHSTTQNTSHDDSHPSIGFLELLIK